MGEAKVGIEAALEFGEICVELFQAPQEVEPAALQIEMLRTPMDVEPGGVAGLQPANELGERDIDEMDIRISGCVAG